MSPSFSFLMCKLGIITLSSYGTCKVYLRIYRKAFSPVDNKHSAYSSYFYDSTDQGSGSKYTRTSKAWYVQRTTAIWYGWKIKSK